MPHDSAKTIKVLKPKVFASRLRHVGFFVAMAREAVEQMADADEIAKTDVATLSIADDTAAWICGRVLQSNYVTLRVKCSRADFVDSSVLKRLHFEQSYEQKLLGDADWRYFIFLKYTIPMIKLIVVKTESELIHSNPCAQLSYLINVCSGAVATRDCDCLRQRRAHGYVELQLDGPAADQHSRSLLLQEDLVEEPHDDKIIEIVCVKNKTTN